MTVATSETSGLPRGDSSPLGYAHPEGVTMAQTYDDLLVWAYVGEVWGQHMLERLLEDDTFSSERDDLLLLLALETRTRQSLESLISSRGLVVELGPAHQEAEDYAQRLAQEQDWEAFMRETHGIATSALPDFERLRDLAPASEVEPLVETVEHEQAVLSYSSCRLAGQPDQAAMAVSDHLGKWMPRPVEAP